MKRWLSMLLALCMVWSMLIPAALAEAVPATDTEMEAILEADREMEEAAEMDAMDADMEEEVEIVFTEADAEVAETVEESEMVSEEEAVQAEDAAELADIALTPITGAEVITGSTRMKAGTATKMVLNMLTTATMIKLGKVYGNLMVDVHATNDKLRDRARRIIMTATGCDSDRALAALDASDGYAKKAIELINVLDDDGGGVGLSHEAQHLGVTFLTEDHYLALAHLILFLDALLELEHHRAGGIDDLDVVATGDLVGLWGFAVGTEEHLYIVEFAHIVVVDGDEAHIFQTLALHTVVDDIAETI